MMAKGDSAVKPSRVGKTKKVNRPIVLLAQREEREAQSMPKSGQKQDIPESVVGF